MIPDEAVEAAARALYELQIGQAWGDKPEYAAVWEGCATAALEAAAPYLMVPVIQLADELEASDLSGDNYMSGRGSGFRMAGVRIRQVLGLAHE